MVGLNIQMNGHPHDREEGVGRIRVWPSSEDVRKYIKHPLGNIAFRATIMDSVEWPFDQFTKRRLQDGTVLDHPPGTVISDEPAGMQ